MADVVSVYELTMDIKKPTSHITTPVLVQYDNVVLEVTVLDGGKPFDLANVSDIEFVHKRPDGETIVEPGVLEDGKIVYRYVGNEMDVPGNIKTSFSMINGDEKVSVRDFYVVVQKSLKESQYMPGAPKVDRLQQLIVEVENLSSSTLAISELATTQGNYAKEQGDYAKEQGDLLAEKQPEIDVFLEARQNLETRLLEKSDVTYVDRIANTKADKDYVDGLIGSASSGGPRGVFYSISDLITAYPNGQDGTYLILDNSFPDGAHSYIYSSQYQEWTDVGAYQGVTIADRSVDGSKTTFLDKNKNLFNTSDPDFIDNRYISATGTFVNNGDYFTSGFMPANEGDVVVFSNNGVKATGYSLAFYDANKTLISVLYGVAQVDSSKTVVSGSKFIRLSFQKSRFNPNLTQVEVSPSGNASYYVPYGYLFNDDKLFADGLFKTRQIADNSITSPKRTVLGETVHVMLPGNATFPDLNTVNKTLTFGNDTILLYRGRFKQLSTAGGNLVCNFSSISSSAVRIYYDTLNDSFVPLSYNSTGVTENMVFVCVVRVTNGYTTLNCPYTINGKSIYEGAELVQNLLNANVKAVAHRGWESEAPENTAVAFRLAKEKGMSYVETDVMFTSDNEPVILHDVTINRTGRNDNGSEIAAVTNIYDITLAQAKTYDFGIWKGTQFAGSRILTFKEFIVLCKKLNLHPYIELKSSVTTEQAQLLVNIVRRLGMIKNVSWISFEMSRLQSILTNDPNARVGLLGNTLTNAVINNATSLKTSTNDVFLGIGVGGEYPTESNANLVHDAGISLEVWTVYNNYDINLLVDRGVTGMTITGFNLAERLESLAL